MSAKFGTSGLRGLASGLTDGTAARFVRGFARHILGQTLATAGSNILVASDLRQSSPLIRSQVIAALAAENLKALDCGLLPTPALAAAAITRGLPAIMVTGSHIPAERNGLKFYLPGGEISKLDETAIAYHAGTVTGSSCAPAEAAPLAGLGMEFLERILRCLPGQPLRQLRLGVFEHSTVARDLLGFMLERLGAHVVRLGRTATFVALDTEAVEPETATTIHEWTKAHALDALVSADGDGDRPLIADEQGHLLKGDVIGLLTAQFLGAETLVTPVTSNSGIERCFARPVLRTRVGSPYVIAGMDAARQSGLTGIAGFEANGGVLVGDGMHVAGVALSALPTRDCFLPIAAVLCLAAGGRKTVSELVMGLDLPATASSKLEDLPPRTLATVLGYLNQDDAGIAAFLQPVGRVTAIDRTDGLRVTLNNGSVVALRPSGNEPALRCYVEAASEEAARQLLADVERLALHPLLEVS
ncbi:MAG: phosphomannomutase [Rhizobiales bacterium]|nr:phosphomannomutase [Hyphomicrobiales bacterium]